MGASLRGLGESLSSAKALFRPPQIETIGHLYVIDCARGLGALAVLFWHYQSLYFPKAGILLPASMRPVQPLYFLLWPLYEHGFLAVQFFWAISGFVFAAVYSARGTTTKEFVINRVARLYPLHLLTLVVVLFLQVTSFRLLGYFQIYPYNDLYHFILNLFFASSWGLEHGESFNSPIWSVSIEVVIYGVFLATLPFLYRAGVIGPVIVTGLFWLLLGHVPQGWRFYECGFYFFSGATAYLLFASIRRIPLLLMALTLAVVAVGVLLTFIPVPHLSPFAIPLLIIGLLLACATLEAVSLGRHIRRVRWIGDNTYGTYLWHIPVLIVAMVAMDSVLGNRAPISSPWFLVGFVVLVIGLARLSFVYFENPARLWLRRVGSKKQPGTDPLGLVAPRPAPETFPSSIDKR